MPEMLWDTELGYGFYPVEAPPADVYDDAYWHRYCAMADTPMGHALNKFRCEFVTEHFPVARGVLDVGIGSGAFMLAIQKIWHDRVIKGFDVNEAAGNWLMARMQFHDPAILADNSFPLLTFWDSLEHIPAPAATLRKAFGVAMSIPIFRDKAHALSSKHFRPDEHLWYWTERGLIDWMGRQGFKCLATSTVESELGREDIMSFAFRRASGKMDAGFADVIRNYRPRSG